MRTLHDGSTGARSYDARPENPYFGAGADPSNKADGRVGEAGRESKGGSECDCGENSSSDLVGGRRRSGPCVQHYQGQARNVAAAAESLEAMAAASAVLAAGTVLLAWLL